MTRAERSKGKRGELEAVQVLRILLGDPTICRVLQQPREGGYDIEGDCLRHFAVEVKRVRTPLLRAWLDKLVAAHPTRIPLIMWRPDGQRWAYYMRLDAAGVSQYVRLINCLRDGHHP